MVSCPWLLLLVFWPSGCGSPRRPRRGGEEQKRGMLWTEFGHATFSRAFLGQLSMQMTQGLFAELVAGVAGG